MRKHHVMAVVLAVVLCLGLCACKSSGASKSGDAGESVSSESAASESSEVVLADTDELKVVLLGIEETQGIQGATLYLDWENKTDYDVTMYPEDGTANGYSIMIMSGVPTDMKAHGKSKNPLILSYAQFDAQSVDDVHSFSFDAVMRGDGVGEIARAHIEHEL